MTELIILKSEQELKRIRELARKKRFGQSCVQVGDIKIHCTDLAAFYITMKDIFIHRIYDLSIKGGSPFIIDGGAHIGLFSLYAKLKLPDARILAFEPDPDAIDLFRKNIQENDLEGIQLVEGALTHEKGSTKFSTGLSDGCTIYGGKNHILIKTFLLNDFIESKVDCLKLNIEGSEYDVIASLEPKLDLIDLLYIEYHGFPETGQTLHKILEILHRNGFRYMIHDYDHETNPMSKPPFQLNQNTKFFLLICAVNLHPKDIRKCEK